MSNLKQKFFSSFLIVLVMVLFAGVSPNVHAYGLGVWTQKTDMSEKKENLTSLTQEFDPQTNTFTKKVLCMAQDILVHQLH